MALISKDEAISRLEKIAKEYSEKNSDNPTGVVSVAGEENERAIISKHFGYEIMNKILYVINRSDNEYLIFTKDEHVIISISFF